MDELVKKIAAFGLPGVVLMIAMSATGLAGGAALTTALAALGPFGMIGGIVLLATIGLLADKIAELGYEEVTKLVLKEHLKTSSKEEAIELLVEENKTFEVIDPEYLMNIRFIKSLVLAHQDTILAYKLSKRLKALYEK